MLNCSYCCLGFNQHECPANHSPKQGMVIGRKGVFFVTMSLNGISFLTFFFVSHMFGYSLDISVPFCSGVQIILIK